MTGKIRAIFEIDKDVSPKHYAGGVALANIIALRAESPILFCSIVPFKHRRRAELTLRLFETHLGDRWMLRGIVIPTLIPCEVREMVDQAMRLREPRPTSSDEPS